MDLLFKVKTFVIEWNYDDSIRFTKLSLEINPDFQLSKNFKNSTIKYDFNLL